MSIEPQFDIDRNPSLAFNLSEYVRMRVRKDVPVDPAKYEEFCQVLKVLSGVYWTEALDPPVAEQEPWLTRLTTSKARLTELLGDEQKAKDSAAEIRHYAQDYLDIHKSALRHQRGR